MVYPTASGEGSYVELFRVLESYGLRDALLPFLLIFLVIFSVVQKTHIFGADKRNINAVFALIVAALTVIPHITGTYPPGADVIVIMNEALPNVSLVAIAVIMAVFLIGLFGGESKWLGGSLSGLIAVISFGVIIYFFGASAGWWNDFTTKWDWFDTNTKSLIIIIVVFGLLIGWIMRPDSKEEGYIKGLTKLGSGLGDMFKPGGGH